MPQTKLDVFFKQFPWAINFTDNYEVHQVYVSGLFPELLDYRALHISEVVGYETDEYWNEIIYFVDEVGVQVDYVYFEEKYMQRKYLFFGPIVEKTDVRKDESKIVGNNWSIKEVLKGTLKEQKDRVRYIVSHFTKTNALIIYKVPHGTTVSEWIKGQVDGHRRELKKDLVTIDTTR